MPTDDTEKKFIWFCFIFEGKKREMALEEATRFHFPILNSKKHKSPGFSSSFFYYSLEFWCNTNCSRCRSGLSPLEPQKECHALIEEQILCSFPGRVPPFLEHQDATPMCVG